MFEWIDTYQLCYRLFSLFLGLNVDAEIGQVEDEFGIDSRFVARIAIYVCLALSVVGVRMSEGYESLTSSAFGRYSAQLDAHRVRTLLKVSERVTVPTQAAVELSAAAEYTTSEAEPQVLLEIALRTMC